MFKVLEGYDHNGWFWLFEERYNLIGTYLMDDYGNAVRYNYTLACARQISLTY